MRQEAFVARRFIALVGDLYVENLRPAHVEGFVLALLDEHITRDGRTTDYLFPARRPPTWR